MDNIGNAKPLNRITPRQLICLLSGTMLTTYYLILPADISRTAGRLAWMMPLIGMVFPLASTFIFSALSSRKLPLSGLIHLLYSIYFIGMSALLIRLQKELISLYFLPTTPGYILMGILCLVGGWSAALRPSAIGRMNEILFVTSFYILTMALYPWSKGRMTELAIGLPDWGMLKSSLLPVCYTYAGIETLLVFGPQSPPGTIKKSGVISTLLAGLFITVMTVTAMATMGQGLLGKMLFPAVTMLKINDNALSSRLELFMLMVFNLITLKPISNYALATRISMQQGFPRLDNPRGKWGLAVLWAVGAFAVCLAIPNIDMLLLIIPLGGIAFFIFGIALPALLLLFSRKKEPTA
nr:GerAB/ArcD/ProY family transporter [bacterium]